jgi:hypothetical protein
MVIGLSVDTVSLEQLKVLQRPEEFEKLHALEGKKREFEKENFDLRLEYKDRFLNALMVQEGKEAEIEKARLDGQIARAALERRHIIERQTEIVAEQSMAKEARDAPFVSSKKQAENDAKIVRLEEESLELGRQRNSLDAKTNQLKVTKRDLDKKELIFLAESAVALKGKILEQKKEMSLLVLRQQYVTDAAITADYTERASLRALDNRIKKLGDEQEQREVLRKIQQKQLDTLQSLADAGELPIGKKGQLDALRDKLREVELAAKLATKEMDYLTGQRDDTEFIAHGQVLARMGEQQKQTEQHELAKFDIQTAYKEKYTNYWSMWTSKEELQEKAQNARRRERLDKEATFMEQRQAKITSRLSQISNALGATDDPTIREPLIAEQRGLQEEDTELSRRLALNAEEAKAVQQTRTEAANANIRSLMAEGNAVKAATETWAFYGNTLTEHTGLMVDQWKTMFAEMGKTSKDAWDMYKAIAISEAIVDTFRTAQAGAAALAGIPYVGPALALAWIATSIASGMMRVKQIEQQKPQGYATGGVTYGELVMMDKSRSRSASYGTGGVTSGPAAALVGDNPSGREIILPEENIKSDRAQEDVAMALNTKFGKNVVINHIGQDMNERKSTFRKVREINRRSR